VSKNRKRQAETLAIFIQRTFQDYRFAANKLILLELMEMARVCDLCGKGPQFGHKVSHAHNVTNRRWNVNIQSVRAIVNGAHKRIRACTSCIRNGKVQKVA
jgi:large subunit ribosomal protein L28